MQAQTKQWKPTKAQLAQLRRAHTAGPDAWIRAESAGDRVTLASLHTRGLLMRRVWSESASAAAAGRYSSPAHEYKLAPAVRVGFDAALAARKAAT